MPILWFRDNEYLPVLGMPLSFGTTEHLSSKAFGDQPSNKRCHPISKTESELTYSFIIDFHIHLKRVCNSRTMDCGLPLIAGYKKLVTYWT